MPAPYELKTLYDEKRYEDVIAFSNDPQELDAFSIWDFTYCMNSLYRLQKYTEALELYKIFHKKYPASGDLDNKTCWCLYYTKVKSYDDETGDPANLLKNVDFIIKHSDNSPYSPKWKVVDLITKNVGSRWKRLALKCDDQKQLQLINAVDPSTLSCDENIFQQADGKYRKVSSDREKWYSRKTKLLLKIEQYEECILCCNDA
ncbi:MAG: hypothetical protein Q4B18_08105, partial [Bacillota bacterium]|nr:hypothetical protein [Bacillota bacterium]